MGYNEPINERNTMQDIQNFIDTIESFVNTMTTVLPTIAMIAGIVGFIMIAAFSMHVVTSK